MQVSADAEEVSEPDLAADVVDAQLAALAQEPGQRAARDMLLKRSSRLRADLVGRLAREARLPATDQADAEQEAVLWTLEAIQHFHCQRGAHGGCSFRSFLHRVIACRFIDFLRHRLRYHRHVVLVGATLLSEFDGPVGSHRLGVPTPAAYATESESQQTVEEEELHDRIRLELDRLDVRSRRLWGLMIRGASVAEIASVLHTSYDAAKRSRHKLLLRLRTALKSR
jgi:RNA polymerase sigma factor (sigma-70 family)